MSFNTIFVTVGTTKFDYLITEIYKTETIAALKALGCKKIIIQYGNGNEIDPNSRVFEDSNIIVTKYRYKSKILDDIEGCDLVISHAGAGTCMEIMASRKPSVVVVNEALMDNHQSELAEQLHRDGYVVCCTVSTLADTLKNSDFGKLKAYAKGDGLDRFVERLGVLMGL